MWKQLWKEGVITYDDKDIETLKFPLTGMEQLILMRYIEAETVEKDFISRGLGK